MSLVISGCGTLNDTAPITVTTNTNQTNTNQTQNKYKDEYESLKSEYDNLIKIYDEHLSEAINTYCEKYLTYTGNATDNVSKIKDIVSENYYTALKTQEGHKAYDKDYEQATGAEELYYAKPVSPYDSINVAAICKQTIIFDNDVTTNTIIYIFNMKYQNDNWKIDSVEARS